MSRSTWSPNWFIILFIFFLSISFVAGQDFDDGKLFLLENNSKVQT